MHFYYEPPDKNVQQYVSIPVDTSEVDNSPTRIEKHPQRKNLGTGGYLSAPNCSELELTLEETLYSNKAELKILLSRVAMHLTKSKKEDIFKQIDELLNIDYFDEEDDSLVNKTSFASFVKFLCLNPNMKRVALTVSNPGNISGTWVLENGRMHIEFLPDGKYRTSVMRRDGQETESLVHQGSIRSMIRFLADINLTKWYLDEKVSA